MSGLKAIRRRIVSVKNTKQITRAMKLVSAAKLRRAQTAAQNGRAFSDQLSGVMKRVLRGLSDDFSHPLVSPDTERQIKVRRVIIISGERGLCGAYNTNVFKAAQQELNNKSASCEYVLVGRRAVSSAHRVGLNEVSSHEGLPEDVGLWPIAEIAECCISDFISGACDEVVLYYTKFVSAMTQQVSREILLPLGRISSSDDDSSNRPVNARDALEHAQYDPDPESILEALIPRVISSKLRQAGLESKASEHAARMTAMDSATNNASELIDRLLLFYNRARQSTITRELIDIVGGAEAIR